MAETYAENPDVKAVPIAGVIAALKSARSAIEEKLVTIDGLCIPLEWNLHRASVDTLCGAMREQIAEGRQYEAHMRKVSAEADKAGVAASSHFRNQKIKYTDRLINRGVAPAIAAQVGGLMAVECDEKYEQGSQLGSVNYEFTLPDDTPELEDVNKQLDLPRCFLAHRVPLPSLEEAKVDDDVEVAYLPPPTYLHAAINTQWAEFAVAVAAKGASAFDAALAKSSGASSTTTTARGNAFRFYPKGDDTHPDGACGPLIEKIITCCMQVGKTNLSEVGWPWYGIGCVITAVVGVLGVVVVNETQCREAGSDIASYITRLGKEHFDKNPTFLLAPGQAVYCPWGTCPVVVGVIGADEKSPELLRDCRVGGKRALPVTFRKPPYVVFSVNLLMEEGRVPADHDHIAARMVSSWQHYPESYKLNSTMVNFKERLLIPSTSSLGSGAKVADNGNEQDGCA